MRRLEGRVALITGGAAGIGRATALRFAAEGARVVMADLQDPLGDTAVAAIESLGGQAAYVHCDVTDEEQVRAAVAGALRAFGRLDCLVTAAGVLQGAYKDVTALDVKTFARVLDINVLGTFLACKHAVPAIEASGGGTVLCIASGAGVRGPSSSLPYGASKAGVYGFCQTLERQLQPRGIRVHVVCPGEIDTDMKRGNIREGALARGEDPDAALAARELGSPDAVAAILAFLASDEADHVRGMLVTR